MYLILHGTDLQSGDIIHRIDILLAVCQVTETGFPDPEAVAELEKQGMTVTYPDKQQFIDKAADLYAQWEEQYGDMISEIRALSVNK